MPLSLAGHLWPGSVISALERQLRASFPGRLDGRFALRTGLPDALAAGLAAQESALYARIGAEPQPLEAVLTGTSQRATLDRLVARGLVMIAGFTPSDAMHVLGRQDQWNAEAARLGAELFTRRKTGSGNALAQTARDLANMVSARLTRQSAEAILTALFADQGVHGIDPARSVLIDRALDRTPGFVRFGLGLDRPLVALGASAPVHYPAIATMLGADSFVPVHAGVANAVGAVVGQVRETAIAFVTEPEEGRFAVNGAGETRIVRNLDAAFALARELAEEPGARGSHSKRCRNPCHRDL
jgi:N-methylhydantoinase A/oxoprolinase/acetone carboxylase beta subunit